MKEATIVGGSSYLFPPFLEGEPLVIERRIKTSWRQLLTGLILLVTLFINPLQGFAETDSELNFYVTPILPDSQLAGGASGYFDLNIGAGDQDELGLEIQNGSDQAIEIAITIHTAFTNVNGVVEYAKDAETPDPTLPAMIDELVEVPGTITLEPLEKRTIHFPITMPEEAFEGVLAGGIRIQEVPSEDTQSSQEEGLGIKNAFSYVIGLVVSNNRSATDPGLELLDVFADQVNYRNVFSATIQNYTSTFVNRLEVEASIRASNSEEILYESNRSGMQMAPNSHMNFPIPLDGDRFRTGEYVLNLTARSEEEEWTWEQTFTVEAEEARQLNETDVSIDRSINWWMIAAIAVSVVLLGILAYMIYRSKQEKKETQDSESKE